jgi:CheY-like chemotaxis protein
VTTVKTVLVADDTAFIRDRFKAAIEHAGHRVVAVRNADELLARLPADLAHIDLLLIDLRLTDKSGVDIVRDIRTLGGGKLPILVFSGTVTRADEVRELAALGVAGYINEHTPVQQILPSLAPYLLPDEFNRRGSPRVVLGIPTAYRFGHTITAAPALNLSRNGIAIRTTSPLELGTKAGVRFRVPGSQKDVDAHATARWSDARRGMGLQFDRVDPADQTTIDEFIARKVVQPREP